MRILKEFRLLKSPKKKMALILTADIIFEKRKEEKRKNEIRIRNSMMIGVPRLAAQFFFEYMSLRHIAGVRERAITPTVTAATNHVYCLCGLAGA